MVKRTSDKEIVKQSPLVLDANGIDAVFTKDNPNVVFSNSKGVIGSGYSFAANISRSSSGVLNPTGPTNPTGPSGPIVIPPDAPSLLDIESIEFEEYADSNGVAKYKAVIKIRNSSREKANVEGVDARIYNPSGIKTYNFGAGAASSTSTEVVVSPYISKVTWYNAVTKYNPFSGIIYSGPLVIGNSQYSSDGKDVPADAITGPTSYRVKSVWRKTESEAIAAAKVNI